MAEYAKRDIEAQGEHYMRHLAAMTAEKLHSKSDIAAELAHRDMLIEQLVKRLNDAEAPTLIVNGNLTQEQAAINSGGLLKPVFPPPFGY